MHSAPGRDRDLPHGRTGGSAAAALVALLLAGALAAAEPGAVIVADAPRMFWHDLDLVLVGALPNPNPKLGKDTRLTFGRLPPAAAGAPARWRDFVLGYSPLFDDHQRGISHYGWRDDDGRLLLVEEDGNAIRLKLDMTIAGDAWVTGGSASYDIRLVRDGDRLSGTFTGVLTKPEACPISGPAGTFPCQGTASGTLATLPYPAPQPGWQPVAPGEHPRLVFRRSDLPELRRRAETPQGKEIIRLLRAQLANATQKDEQILLRYPAGYGLLWQLTGERAYADQARRWLEHAMSNPRDDGASHTWWASAKLRLGPATADAALAYDLCYDGWDPEYRRTVARRIQERVDPKLTFKTGGGQHNPQSNHYCAWKGGGGRALMAIDGDEGVDQDVVFRGLRHFHYAIRRGLEIGYSDHAYFGEGHHCGRISSNTGLLSYLQAARLAQGTDWVGASTKAQWLTAKWIYELYRRDGQLINHQEGMYARAFGRAGMSQGGDFAQGFGVMPEAFKPAVLWFHDRILEPGAKTYDFIAYPHRAVYALANWPIGVEPKDPAEVLGMVMWDRGRDRAIFRSGWEGESDIVVIKRGGGCQIHAPGLTTHFSLVPGLPTTMSGEKGRGPCLVHTPSGAFVVDFSGAAGRALFASARRIEEPVLPEGLTAEERADRLEALRFAASLTALPVGTVQEVIDRAPAKPAPAAKGKPVAKPTAKPAAADDEVEESDEADGAGPAPATGPAPPLRGKRWRVMLPGGEVQVMLLDVADPPAPTIAGDGAASRIVVGGRRLGYDGTTLSVE